MATNQPDWPTGDEADEALPPVAPPAAQSTAKAATQNPATVSTAAAMHPGWTGGNVGNVTATPQIKSLHPTEHVDEAGEALPPVAKKPSKFALPSPLPANYSDCVALQQKLLKITAANEDEHEERLQMLETFGQHIHRVQQGLPVTNITSVSYGHSAAKHNEILNRQRREMAAQGDMVVAELLKDHDELVKKCNGLASAVANLTTENNELKELLASAK